MRFVVALVALSLAGCASNTSHPPAWTYYDQCAEHEVSFLAIAQCGTEHRNTTCNADNSCTPGGNAIVMYVNSLVVSIRNHEISESEAQRKWVEYRMTQIYAYQMTHRY